MTLWFNPLCVLYSFCCGFLSRLLGEDDLVNSLLQKRFMEYFYIIKPFDFFTMVETKSLLIRTFLHNAYLRVKFWWYLDLVGAAANATYKVFDVDISQTIVKCLLLFPVVFSSIINLHPLSFGIRRNHVRKLSSPVILHRIFYKMGSFVL